METNNIVQEILSDDEISYFEQIEKIEDILEQHNNPVVSEEFNKILESIKTECILNSGISVTDSIIHFGGADKNNLFLKNIMEIERTNPSREFGINYTIIDADDSRVEQIKHDLDDYSGKMVLYAEVGTIQDYFDQEKKPQCDWVIISDIFNKNLYEENQIKFFNRLISESFEICEKGVIISINDSKSKLNIRRYISYLHEEFNRYRIERLNENIYIITIYTTFLSNKI